MIPRTFVSILNPKLTPKENKRKIIHNQSSNIQKNQNNNNNKNPSLEVRCKFSDTIVLTLGT